MATDLQNKLYRSNQQFLCLAELMAQQIYPRLIDALKKLGMEEVRFKKINDWKEFCFTIDGKIQFFKTLETDNTQKDLTRIYELDFSGKKICPLFFEDVNTSIKEFESPFPDYKVFCETVIQKLEYLEQNFIDANSIILKIENLGGVSLDRKVLFEKINK